jgi:membrane protease YdiL (CAAX protease family)
MIAYSPPAGASRWKRWLVYSALARIVIFFLAFAAGVALIAGAFKLAGVPGKNELVRFAVQVGASVLAYLFLTRVVEKRWPAELGARLSVKGTVLGFVAGIALISAVVGIMGLLGAYTITATHADINWWTPLLAVGFGAGISEEIIVRGVIFRATEEALGTVWALVISALFFGLPHLANPGATIWSALAIAIEAGILLGMLYHLTRSLWPCIGLHAGWNFTQGTIWGVPVSGTATPSFVTSERHGAEWLTGGAWGAEASVVGIVVCTLAGVALVVRAVRRRTLVQRARAPEPMMEASTPA